jgi:hypothetical protein
LRASSRYLRVCGPRCSLRIIEAGLRIEAFFIKVPDAVQLSPGIFGIGRRSRDLSVVGAGQITQASFDDTSNLLAFGNLISFPNLELHQNAWNSRKCLSLLPRRNLPCHGLGLRD